MVIILILQMRKEGNNFLSHTARQRWDRIGTQANGLQSPCP